MKYPAPVDGLLRPLAPYLVLSLFLSGLLVPLGMAQEDAPPAYLGAPVQTVVDAVPDVVDWSIEEARFDGTPDRAWALTDRMEAFTVGFAAGGEWTEGSDAARWPVNQWLRYAVHVVGVAAAVPDRVAAVERTGARCDAWFENATRDDVRAWGQDVRRAGLGISALRRLMVDMVERAPPVVDAAPLQRAHDRLVAWQSSTGPRVVECVVAAEREHGLEEEPVIVLHAVPRSSWPLGVVRFTGGSNLAEGTMVSLDAPAMGLATSVTLPANGTFFLDHRIPLDADLGEALVRARSGDLEATVVVHVERIPVRLLVSGPDQVAPSSDFSLRVDATAAVDGGPVPGSVSLSGAVSENGSLENGSATFDVVSPAEDATMVIRVHYAGTERFAPAEARFVVQVGGEETAAFAMERFVPDEREEGFDRTQQAILLGVGVVVLLALILLPRLVARKRPSQGAAWNEADLPPLPARGPLVPVFALFYAWAVRLGWARASDTPREMARKVGEEGLDRSVREFERVRYGDEAERPERSVAIVGWLRNVWGRRVRRDP